MSLQLLSSPAFEPRLLAAIGGAVSWVYLHHYPVRGDVGLALEFALGAASFFYSHIILGSEIGSGLVFATSVVLCHYLALAVVTIAWRISPFHPLYKFPGPFMNKCTNITVALVVYSGKRHQKIYQLHQKYGTIVRIAPDALSINSDAAIAPIYSSSRAFSKSDAYLPAGFKGDGLFFILPREVHNVRRRLWAPAFTPGAIASYKPTVETRTAQLMQVLLERRDNQNGCVDLGQAIHHWSYDIMGDLTFGGANRLELMKNNDVHGYVASGQTATVVFDVLGHVPALFNILWHLPVSRSINRLESIARTMIENRAVSKATNSADIASHLLGEHESSQGRLNDNDLRLDTLLAIQAGSDATAGLLELGIFQLLTHKAVYDRLREELDKAFPDHDAHLPSETLNSLPYLTAVIDEFLRVCVLLSGLPRVTPSGGAHIAGAYIPEGTIVSVPIYTQSLNPENFWPHPEAFKPERWLPGGLGPESKVLKSGPQAFSFGPYGCLGKQLAIQEIRVLISKLLLTYDLSLPSDFDKVKFVEGIQAWRSTVLKHPLRVVITPRH